MVSGDFCEHDWPGSSCPDCRRERLERAVATPTAFGATLLMEDYVDLVRKGANRFQIDLAGKRARDAIYALATPAPLPAVGVREAFEATWPEEPDEDLADAIREAWFKTPRPGISGMTIDAQWRADFAKERAVYRAILAALSPATAARGGEDGQ